MTSHCAGPSRCSRCFDEHYNGVPHSAGIPVVIEPEPSGLDPRGTQAVCAVTGCRKRFWRKRATKTMCAVHTAARVREAKRKAQERSRANAKADWYVGLAEATG